MISGTITDPASNEFYAPLPPDVRHRLEEHEEARVFAQGEKLISKNIPPSHLIIIKSGSVEISVPGRNAGIRIAVAGTGKVLGLRALVSGELPEIDATCLEDCVVILIPKSSFVQLLRKHPQIYLSVAKVLSADLQAAHRQLRNHSRR